MGKRRPVVVISSSEEDDDEHGEVRGSATRGSRGRSKSRSRSNSAAQPKRPRGGGPSKKGRVSTDASHDTDWAKFDKLSEGFCEQLHDFSITPGFTCMDRRELWIDKHKPCSSVELAVHKKKVEEIRTWLEERMKVSKDKLNNCVLLVTGKAGVGKSTALHVIASELGAELCEWTTPTPTLWQEHIHNSSSGLRYMSKLEEFESFMEKTCKYSLLNPIPTGELRKPTILLIDDIPVVNGRGAFSRLTKCLTTLTQFAQVPTVILITEYHQTEYINNATEYWEDLQSSIERAGACKVSFNPITVNSIRKTLTRICQKEKYNVPAESIDQISKESGGDIRNAITSLQYFCIRMNKLLSIEGLGTNATNQELLSANPSLLMSSSFGEGTTNSLMSLPWGRDETLSLFHALGKFLHNKRDSQTEPSLNLFALKGKLQRYPIKMDTPEKVLSQAYGQARPVTDFLHENVLDFIADDAIESAWIVSSYLCDADYILASNLRLRFSRLIPEIYELDGLTQLVGASVAVRGVLFGNSQPSPSRWHAIRTPRLWQIERSLRSNKIQMLMERFEARNRSSFSGMSYIATEYRPAIKWIDSQLFDNVHRHENVSAYVDRRADDFDLPDEENLRGNIAEESEEDDIEDC